jgi:hypothetical protein
MKNNLEFFLNKEHYISIRIEQKYSLKETAQKLESHLNGLTLKESDAYDEVSVFKATWEDYEFILQGLEAEAQKLHGTGPHFYHLWICHTQVTNPSLISDGSKEFATELGNLTGLNCF